MKTLDPKATEFSEIDSPMLIDAAGIGTVAEPLSQSKSDPVEIDEATAALRLAWDNRRLIARVVAVSTVFSVAAALLIPGRYQSTAKLMPPDNQSSSGLAMAASALSGGSANLGGMASELLGLKSSSDLLVAVITSHTVENKLIGKFDLKALYGDRRMADVRKDLEKHTDVAVDRKSQVITITVTDKSPARAQAMAGMYVDELNRTLAQVSTSSARRERIFLEGRLADVSKDLEGAERDFSQFSSKNTAIDIKEQSKAMVNAAATLQGQLIAAESELKGLRPIYTANNVRVRSVQARIDELQAQLEKIGGKGEGTSANATRIDDSMYPSIKELPLLGVTYADLYRKTKIEEAVLETLTKEYELAKVEEAKEIPTVKVLDAPDLPDKKSFPPRTVIVLLGAALGLAGAVTWILGREVWDATSAANPRKALAQEVFATVRASLLWNSRNGQQTRGSALDGRGKSVTGQKPAQ